MSKKKKEIVHKTIDKGKWKKEKAFWKNFKSDDLLSGGEAYFAQYVLKNTPQVMNGEIVQNAQ
jgi:hypothetical protein